MRSAAAPCSHLGVGLALGLAVTPDDRLTVFSFGSYDLLGEEEEGGLAVVFGVEFYRLDLRYQHRFKDGELRLGVLLGLDRTALDGNRTARDRMFATRADVTYRVHPDAEVRLGVDQSMDSYVTDIVGYTVTRGGSRRLEQAFGSRDDTALGAHAVTDEDLALLESLTAGVYVEGKATKAGVTKVFRWSFVAHDFCSPGFDEAAEEVSGATFRVGSGATERVDLAIRGDHLFFDRLEAGAEVRFDPIAGADTDPAYGNADGEVTREELVRVPLSAIEGADGAYLAEAPIDLATWMYMLMDHTAYLGGTEACSPFDREDAR